MCTVKSLWKQIWGIVGDRIVAVLPGEQRAANQIVDAGGRYAIPGFMDAHIHIESALLTPDRLAEVVVPTGTTTLLVDPMEIANVAGYEGLVEFFARLPIAVPHLCRRYFYVCPRRLDWKRPAAN